MTDITKLIWAQVGRISEPGRYMFRFGWLTITAEDLWVWENHPAAVFTLVRTRSEQTDADEFRLGTFELGAESNFSEGER